MRPTLFRLASDTEDNDEALGKNQQKVSKNIFVLMLLPFLNGSPKTRGVSHLFEVQLTGQCNTHREELTDARNWLMLLSL